MRYFFLALSAALVASACGPTGDAPGAAESSVADTSLRSFQHASTRTDSLDHASPSSHAAAERLARALHRHDTAELKRIALSRAEFAYLYFPGHVQSRPPYELPPDVMWMRNTAANEIGARRLLREFGGRRLDASGFACQDSVQVSPLASELRRCGFGTVRVGGIVVVGGRYKILGYSPD